MLVKIFGEWEQTEKLYNKVQLVLEELWLIDFISLEKTNDENLKKELEFSKTPALIIEEESIDFKDVIFDWTIPEEDELKSMFVSIIWWGEMDSCAPSSCSSCGSASVCGV